MLVSKPAITPSDANSSHDGGADELRQTPGRPGVDRAGAGGADAALKAFLAEADEARSNQLLEQLLCQHAQPLVKTIVASKLGRERTGAGGSPEVLDLEDVCNEVAVRLLKRLRRLKASLRPEFLSDFLAYTAVTAHNACSHYLRRKYPERLRIKNRLRYALLRDERFALWENGGTWICGFAEWRHQDRPVAGGEWVRMLREDSELAGQTAAVTGGGQIEVGIWVELLFGRIEGPVELDRLAGEVAETLARPDITPVGLSGPGEIGRTSSPVDVAGQETDRIDQQLYLRQVCSEIQSLPIHQRAALLLNLRDQEGQELLTLLTEARAATLDQLAEALGISATKLAQLWNRLPIQDAEIAQELGLSRQQVINLRVSARRRLARRMAAR
jgi:RNA polymerase sigma factor (sigma-70 family)